MINDQLLSYIKQQLSLGIGRETITTNLKAQGWTDADIQEAFLAISPTTPPPATPPSASIPVSPTPSTVFGLTPNVVQMQTAQTTIPNTVHKKSKKMFFAILILVLLCFIGGGAAYAYYTGYFVTLPNLLSEYSTRAQALESLKIDMDLDVDFSEIKSINDQLSSVPFLTTNNKKLNLGFLASYDYSDRNNIKISSDFSATLGDLSVEAQMIILSSSMYTKITKIPDLSFLPMPMPEEYQNKWFSFPYKSSITQNLVNQFTDEENDHLEKMFLDAHILKNFKRLSPETIAGEHSYHFSFDLDQEAFVAYMQSYKNYLEIIKKGELSDFNLESFKKGFDLVKDFKGEIWVGRNDRLVHKLSVSFGIQPDVSKDEQVRVSMVGIVSDYNKPVSIVAPADSTPFQTLIEASISEAQKKGNEAAIKATMSNMRAQAEFFWDSKGSYSGFCVSKDLKASRTYIEDKGGTGFVCKEVAQKYAIAVKFPESSENWCVDSTGASKSTATLPSGTVCP